MLKIDEIHVAPGVRGEYVVLQNLGLVTVSLRGWALCTDAYLNVDGERLDEQMYVFRDDIPVKPYTRVVLFTGTGEDGWVPTTDGRQAYCAYWNRSEPIWSVAESIHVLHVSASRKIHGAAPTIKITAHAIV